MIGIVLIFGSCVAPKDHNFPARALLSCPRPGSISQHRRVGWTLQELKEKQVGFFLHIESYTSVRSLVTLVILSNIFTVEWGKMAQQEMRS